MHAVATDRSAKALRVVLVAQGLVGIGATCWALKSWLQVPGSASVSAAVGGCVAAGLGLGLIIQVVAMCLVAYARFGAWRHVRIGALALLSAWGVSLAWMPTVDQLRAELLLAGAASLFGLGILFLGAHRWRASRTAELLCLQLGVTAVGLELALAVWAVWAPSPLWMVETPDVRRRLAALARPAGEPHMGFLTNSLGHYDVEFVPRAERDKRTIAMIGDSFSASFVPHRYHFTTVAERALGDTEIYNFGIPGIGPPEYLHLLQQQAMPLEPDAVVISVFCGNDLAIRPPRAANALWSWFDRAQVRLCTIPTRLAMLWSADATSPAIPHARATGGLLVTEAEQVDAYPWLFDHTLEPGTFSQEAYLSLVRERLSYACQAEQPPVGVLLDYIDQMRAAAGEVPFGVVLVPAEFQVEQRLWHAATRSVDQPSLDHNEPQESLRASLSQRGVRYLDLLPALRAVAAQPDGDRHCYLLRDTHFNVRGNEVAGRAIADWIACWSDAPGAR